MTGPAIGSRRRPLILAHRGDHRETTENSLGALRAAMRVPGIDGVELDVRLAADGVAVLLHDASLARVQGVELAVGAVGSVALARLGVPSLAAALDAVPSGAFLDIELKEDAVAATVAWVRVARGDPPASVVLSSFAPDVLARAAELVPSWPRWLDADRLDADAIAVAAALGCAAISAGWRSIDERSMAMASAAGLEIAAWTVISLDAVDRLASLGVTAICVEGEALPA
jgi:glycerophosphoryl diester phosphodiesterase